MSMGLISQIRRMLGQYQPLSDLTPSFRTVPIPNLPVSVAEKALESLNGPAPLRGGMKDVSFPFFRPKEESPPLLLRITDAGAGSSSRNPKSKNHID
jgi:hypothetical protein